MARSHDGTEDESKMNPMYYHPPPPIQRAQPVYYHNPIAYRPASAWTQYHSAVAQGHSHHHHSNFHQYRQYPQAPPPYFRPTNELPTARAPPPYFRPSNELPTARAPTPPPPNVVYVHEKGNARGNLPELIYQVRETDVLCGRGAPSQHHAGNHSFKQLVDRFQSCYIAARRVDKPEIATRIVEMVRARGGRFLKRTKVQGTGMRGHFCWQEIGEQRAYEKACQALRDNAPNIRRRLASKEIAAAALCLENISNKKCVVSPIAAEKVAPIGLSQEERDDWSSLNHSSFRCSHDEERE